jgi:hypothetical protein
VPGDLRGTSRTMKRLEDRIRRTVQFKANSTEAARLRNGKGLVAWLLVFISVLATISAGVVAKKVEAASRPFDPHAVAFVQAPGSPISTFHGTFELMAIDGHTSATGYFLRVANTIYRLDGKSSFHLKPRQPADVTGVLHGNTITVSSINPAGPAPPRAMPTTGTLNVLVELVYWTAPDNVTQSQAQQQYSSVDNTWFQATSYGSLGTAGAATNWLPIAAPSAPGGAGYTPCDNVGQIETEGDQAASSAGYSLPSFDHFVYYYPTCPGEQWGGWGEVQGNRTWLIGEMDTRVSVHELGHNLGLEHSHSAACTSNGQSVPFSTACTLSEYGDPVSAMGAGFSGQGMYAPSQEAYLGWLGTGSHAVATVTASATYILVPYESVSGGLQALEVSDGAGTVLWMEYRQPTGNDSFLWTGDTDGVLIRTADASNASILYDMTGGGVTNAALPAGASWFDPVGNMVVTVRNADASGATVSITTGVTSPSAPTSVQATAGNASATVSWSAPSNSGSSAIASYNVTLSPGGVTDTITGSPPGNTAIVSGLTNGTAYTFTVTATNAQFATSVASAPSNSVTPTAGGCPAGTKCPNAPSTVSIKQLIPSTVSTSGAFQAQLVIVPPASTPATICNYRIDRAINGVWSTVATQASTTYTMPAMAPASGQYQYRVLSEGCNGALSPSATSSVAFYPRTFDQSALAFGSLWKLTGDTNAYGGSLESSTTIGASIVFNRTFYNLGLMFKESTAGGKITIYVDGVSKGSVNLYASSIKERLIAFKWGTAPPAGTHTVKIVLAGSGSGGGKTVAFDGFTELSAS